MKVDEIIVDQPIRRAVRVTGLVVPFVMLGYGLLVRAGLVDDVHYLGDTYFFTIIALWIAIGVTQYIWPTSSRNGASIHLVAYFVFGLGYIIGVTGFLTPLTPLWLTLFIAPYAYFSNAGLIASMVLLGLAALIDGLFYHHDDHVPLTNLLTMLSILSVGSFAVILGRLRDVDWTDLISSREQAGLQRNRMATLINNLADAIISTDKKGVVRMYNASTLNLLDTNSNLDGQTVNDILPLQTKDGERFDLWQALKEAKSVITRDDLQLSQADEMLRLELTYSPIRDTYAHPKGSHAPEGYILILRDVTKAKSLEEERDEFISVVSHELRTPITITEGTISNVQLMMERPNVSEKTLKDGIKTAHEQVVFLAKMVNDLSTLSRAERGVADAPEDITVRDLVNDLYKEYSPQASARKLQFNLDLGTHLGTIKASPLYLKELLQNFITNALKYTKEGTITLHVGREDGNIIFEVRDTGIGISKSDQIKIFNKFYRSEDYRTRETNGTGLGLYVAAKLAKKLGTTIQLHSRLNHGSTFSISLPVEASPSEQKR